MRRLVRLLRPRSGDEGVALVTVLLTMMVIMGLTATVAAVGIDNLRNSNADRQTGSALAAADAGVAQAIVYIRGNSIGALTCPESNKASCTSQPAGWASPTSPQQVALATNGCTNTKAYSCAKVYITAVTPFNPPTVKTGVYAIHSLGLYGGNPGARAIVVNVDVTPDTFPIGVFGAQVTANGNTAVETESLFTQGCVSPLFAVGGNGLEFTGIDAYWGQPSAPHSTVGVSTSNSSACTSKDKGPVPPGPGTPSTAASDKNCYEGSNAAPTQQTYGTGIQTGLDFYQSASGGLVSATAGKDCFQIYQRADGTYYPDGTCPSGVTATYTDGLCATTSFTTTDLQRYGYVPRGLTDAQYAALKATAQSEGTYNLAETSISSALTADQAAGIADPVLFWDCSTASACSSGAPTVKVGDFPSSYTTAPTSSGTCPSSLPVVTIVVEHNSSSFLITGGNNTWIDAAIFVPDGSYGGKGGANIYGTMFAGNTLSLGGNQDFELDNCWLKDFAGAVLSVTQVSFREDDASEIQ